MNEKEALECWHLLRGLGFVFESINHSKTTTGNRRVVTFSALLERYVIY